MNGRLRRTLLVSCAFALAALVGACNGSNALAPLPPGGKRVLFIGNSLTYSNDLPRTIADLASSIGEERLVYRMVAKPDYALADHWFDGIRARIENDDWHFVVMQQGPSSLPDNEQFLRSWTVQFDGVISAAGARSALYMVWPSAFNAATFDGVRTSYRNAALDVGGMFIPAGEAWRTAWAADSSFVFYADDLFHPSRLGTYVAALVHFEMLYGRNASDLPDTARVDGVTLDITPAKVAQLQLAAHETVVAWGIP